MNAITDDREGFAAFVMRLRALGMPPKALLAAMEATPRRTFVPTAWQSVAWSDRMVPIECGETLEGADLQAAVIAALQLEPGHRVLEVGTGSGFTAAVMARMAARVVTVDRYRTLTEQARQRFEALGISNAFVRHADGANGLVGDGPFDRIVAWVAFEHLPRAFVDQLSANGVMIAPIGLPEEFQLLAKLTKTGSRFEREDLARVRLQPIVRGLAAVL
ncbi:MAG: protein-L-isoaspartate(D-aspartate) O-methyltransferase [Mesorhizobium sp.]|jgi:protein-L-isoaspartate(D-aspartate) O-methyltransferase